MISLQCDIHIHTLRDDVTVRDTDLSCYRYYDKASAKLLVDKPYHVDKSIFASARGQTWIVDNKRPEKIRTALKEVEELIAEQSVLFTKWRSKFLFQLVLQTGVIITLVLNKLGDLARIHVDRYLVGRLLDNPTDLCFTTKHIIVVYLESKMSVITFSKPVKFDRLDGIGHYEPRISVVELTSPSGRRLSRRIVADQLDANGQLLVWWPVGDQELFPWTPQLKEEERANMLLYQVDSMPMRLLGHYRTNTDPLYFRFLPGGTIHYLGQNLSSEGKSEPYLENVILSVEQEKLIRKKVSRTLRLPHNILCHCHVPLSDSVILSTIDGTIISYDQVENRIDNQVKGSFIPTSLSAHPEGSILLSLNEKGLLQCYDIALTPVQLSFTNEDQPQGNVVDFSHYFRSRSGRSIRGCFWSCPASDSSTSQAQSTQMGFSYCLLRIQGGPLLTLRFSLGIMTGGKMGPFQVVAQYLRMNQFHQVLTFMNQLSWAHLGEMLLMCVTLAFNTFMKLPLTREKDWLLEMCVGLFLAPAKQLADEVKDEYSDHIRDITRRFFHYLLKNDQLVKGFQLAVDVNDYDLYMDVYHAAIRRDIPNLGQAALLKAKAVYNENTSRGQSSSNSAQSTPTPFQLFSGGAESLLPGQQATFHKTTAARKIPTQDFRLKGEQEFGEDGVIKISVSQTHQADFETPDGQTMHGGDQWHQLGDPQSSHVPCVQSFQNSPPRQHLDQQHYHPSLQARNSREQPPDPPPASGYHGGEPLGGEYHGQPTSVVQDRFQPQHSSTPQSAGGVGHRHPVDRSAAIDPRPPPQPSLPYPSPYIQTGGWSQQTPDGTPSADAQHSGHMKVQSSHALRLSVEQDRDRYDHAAHHRGLPPAGMRHERLDGLVERMERTSIENSFNPSSGMSATPPGLRSHHPGGRDLSHLFQATTGDMSMSENNVYHQYIKRTEVNLGQPAWSPAMGSQPALNSGYQAQQHPAPGLPQYPNPPEPRRRSADLQESEDIKVIHFGLV